MKFKAFEHCLHPALINMSHVSMANVRWAGDSIEVILFFNNDSSIILTYDSCEDLAKDQPEFAAALGE